jgi:hypothetical protein
MPARLKERVSMIVGPLFLPPYVWRSCSSKLNPAPAVIIRDRFSSNSRHQNVGGAFAPRLEVVVATLRSLPHSLLPPRAIS